MNQITKDIRARPLPDGWKWAKLGDVADCRLGKTPRRADYREEGFYRIIKFRDVNEGTVDFSENSQGYVVDNSGALKGLREVSNGDTLLTASAHSPEQIGRKCAFIESLPVGFAKIFFVGELLAISPNQDYLDPRWPYYWLRSVEGKKGVQEAISGVHLTNTGAQHLLIPLPPFQDQKRISAILNEHMLAVEKAKRAAEERLEAAKALPDAYLREVFPSSEAELPDGWKWLKLGDLCEVKGGKRLPKGAKFSADPTPYHYIRVIDFTNRSVDTSQVLSLAPEIQKTIERYTISSGDVYISIAGTIGLIGRVPASLDGANLTENAAKLVFSGASPLYQDYTVYYLESPLGREVISRRTNVVGQPKLALERIRTIPIPVPPLEEQKRIALELDDKIAGVTLVEESVQQEMETIKSVPAALLSKAFSGEL